MATEVVPFTGFAYGEYGSLSPFSVGFAIYRQRQLYKGYWTGQNMMRGLNGTLFPRSGEKPYILTGVPNGELQGLGYGSASGNVYIWFAVGNSVYRFRADTFTSQAVETYTGTFAAFTEPLAWVDHNGVSYAFAYPQGQYKLDHGAKTVSLIAAGPQAYSCCIYGDRLMAGSGSTLYWSAAADFESWPADNFTDIGDSFNIQCLNSVRGRLAIGKTSSLGQPWFVMSGVPGFNDVLRQTEVSMVAPHADAAVDMGPAVGLVTDIEGTLATFDGSHLHPLPHLQVASSVTRGLPSQLTCFRLRSPGEWGAVVDNTIDAHDTINGSIWLFRNGAWTRHQRTLPANIVSGAYSLSMPDQSLLAFGQGGDSSHKATFCGFNPYREHPPFPGDGRVALPAADCFFSFPEWWSRDGNDVAIKAVVVDFLSWDTGDTNPNTFTVDAVAMRTYDPTPGLSGSAGGDKAETPVRTYSETPSNTSPTGTRRRFVVKYSGQNFGNGFRLDVNHIRGVSFEKFLVVLESKSGQDR